MRASLLVAVAVIAASGCRTPVPSQPSTRLAVRDSPELGRYVTDDAGRPVYVLDADAKATSICYDECAAAWPPVVTVVPPVETAEPAIQPELIGFLQRRDGQTQLTYNGHALYYRGPSAEASPTAAVADGWGKWSLLFPHGDPITP